MSYLPGISAAPYIAVIEDGMPGAAATAAQPRADQTVYYCSATGLAELPNTGDVFPTVGTSVAEGGYTGKTWVNPGNITTDDNVRAQYTTNDIPTGTKMYLLKAQGFDFSAIDSAATILGISVTVNAWFTTAGGADISLVQLLDTTGALAGSNLASTPTALGSGVNDVHTWGSDSSLWGNALTGAWVKDADFGVAVGISVTGDNPDLFVDYVTMKVYYANPGVDTTIGDGTLAHPYALSVMQALLDSTPDLYVYMSGTFEPATYSTNGPLVSVSQSGTTIDMHTYSAVLRGRSDMTWTASGSEYWTTVSYSSPFFRLTEDGELMQGVNAHDTPASRMLITSSDATADTVTFNAYRAPAVDDPIVFISASAGGLTLAQRYYVKSVVSSSGTQSYTVTLSTTIGGATLDITSNLSGQSKYLWSNAAGRYTDPVPGSLLPGQYAWAPNETGATANTGRLYMRPSSGVPGDHTYTLWQTNSVPYLIAAGNTAIENVKIVGGTLVGAPAGAVVLGSRASGDGFRCDHSLVIGCTISGALRGVQLDTGEYNTVTYCHVSHTAAKGVGSLGLAPTSAENHNVYDHVWIHDMGTQFMSGDCEAVVLNVRATGCTLRHSVIQNIGYYRDLVANPISLLPAGQQAHNIGGIIVDDATGFYVYGNYVQTVYGRVVEIPADTQTPCSGYLFNNIFDQRDLIPYTPGVTGSTVSSAVIRAFAGASATQTMESQVYNNLFIMGDCLADPGGSWDASVFQYRCGKALMTATMQMKTWNNIIVLDDDAAPYIIHATRTNGTNATMLAAFQVEVDNNCYVASASNTAALGRALFNSTAGQTVPVSSVTVQNLPNGWTGQSGIACDFNSVYMTPAQLLDAIEADGMIKADSALIGAGKHVGYRRDARGVQRQRPPAIGLYDIVKFTE